MSEAKRDLMRLLRKAEKKGCAVTGGGGSHFKVRCPDGRLVVASASPSTARSVKATRSLLRRHGVRIS